MAIWPVASNFIEIRPFSGPILCNVELPIASDRVFKQLCNKAFWSRK